MVYEKASPFQTEFLRSTARGLKFQKHADKMATHMRGRHHVNNRGL